MNPQTIVCNGCAVADRAVCSVLTEPERAELARMGRRRRYRRGETIMAAGDESTVFATLVEGVAKLSLIDSDGTERIMGLVHPAGMMGQLFTPSQRLNVTAVQNCEACIFPRDSFEALTASHPALAQRVLKETLRDLDESRSLIDMISRRQAPARVAALLLSFSRASSPSACFPADAFDLPLTRGEMAQLLGLTIETVSRSITALERDGMIRRTGSQSIAITDRPALEALVA